MRPYPRSRATGEIVREVVACTLLEAIADPRLALVTVTSVDMSPDLRHATVFIAVHGDAERYGEALAGLESAKGRIRSLLGAEVRMKYVPELHFRMDPSLDEAFRIDAAIRSEYRSGRLRDGQPSDEQGDTDA